MLAAGNTPKIVLPELKQLVNGRKEESLNQEAAACSAAVQPFFASQGLTFFKDLS